MTDGCLRATARATARPPYWFPAPFHPYASNDPKPLASAEDAEIAFDLFPVSCLFRRGHRIRVAISGADRDNFAPVARISVHDYVCTGPRRGRRRSSCRSWLVD